MPATFRGSFFRDAPTRKQPASAGRSRWTHAESAETATWDVEMPPAWPAPVEKPAPIPREQVIGYVDGLGCEQWERLQRLVKCHFGSGYHDYNEGSFYWGKALREVVEDILRRERDIDLMEVPEPINREAEEDY